VARKRMIDPSFWVDEKLGTVDPLVRLLFMGLISQADDDGRLNGHPALIRSLIYPYDHQITLNHVEEWLELLAAPERKLIIRYEVDHQKYIWIHNFKKHQTINKPQKSKLPEYYCNDTVVVAEGDGTDPVQKKLREEKLREEEEKAKGREENMPTPDDNPHKDRILSLINECNIEKYTLHDLDIIYSYIGVVEIEVIEACIKKAQGKHINYAINTLKGKVQEGVVKKEQLFKHPEVGTPSNVRPLYGNRTNPKPYIPGMQPSTSESNRLTPEELEAARAVARELDERFNQKEAEAL
jgi:hypothetical protein